MDKQQVIAYLEALIASEKSKGYTRGPETLTKAVSLVQKFGN